MISNQRCLNPAVALGLVFDGKLYFCGSCEETADVIERLNLLVVHDCHHR